MKVVLLSGGVGGAKLAAGLYDVLAPGELTIVGNDPPILVFLALVIILGCIAVVTGIAYLVRVRREANVVKVRPPADQTSAG